MSALPSEGAAPNLYDNASAEEAARQAAAIGHATTTPYFPEVESLRGIAMALVYAFHIDRFMSGPLPTDVSLAYAFVRAGHTGVSLFFVLSGFLLSLPFIDGVRRGRLIRPRRFYGRRALRILPLYYTAVLVGVAFSAHRPSDLLAALPYMAFLNAVAGWATPLPDFGAVWWSLATEIQFYILLPLLPLLLRSRAGRVIGIAALIVYGAAYVAFLHRDLHMPTIEGQFMFRLSLFGQAPMFLFGITVAAIYVHAGERLRERLQARPWLRRGGGDAVLFLVIASLATLLRWQVWVTHTVSENAPVFGWHLLEGACWATILGSVLFLPLRSRWIWRSAVLGHLGVISYSMYMWHIPVERYVVRAFVRLGVHGGAGWTGANAGITAVITVVCIGISELTYRYIELPFLRRKARLT